MNNGINKEQDNREWQFAKARRSRNFLFYIISLILLGAGVAFYSFLFDINTSFVKIFVFADAFSVVLLVVYWYLQITPIYITEELFLSRGTDDRLKNKIDSLREIEEAISIYEGTGAQEYQLAEFITNRLNIFPNDREFRDNQSRLSPFDKEILKDQTRLRLFKASLNTLKNRLLDEKSAEEEKVRALSAEESGKEKSIERVNALINLATTRLKREIELLSKRANIYIAFGSAITLAAGVVLYFTVQDILNLYPAKGHEIDKTITSADIFSMVIRLSIVIFIEVFAFYYLRLYRNLIDDIKFYQNEITNIEMKILSMHTAESEECKKILVSELAKTERNFIISNKQTTIDLERQKKDFDILKSSTESIIKIIKSVKS